MPLIGSTPLTMLRTAAVLWRTVGALALRRGRGRGLILTYHDIGCGVAPELFKQQMDHLRRHARVMTLEALFETVCSGRAQDISCAITFDDGYEGVYRYALPCLQKYGFPAIIYLATDFIRDSGGGAKCACQHGLREGRPLLSWQQISNMARAGIRFGSHLSQHGDLAVLGRGEAMAQLCSSRDEIATRLGKPCEHFAYPFGRFSRQSVNWVREAGYQSAVTTVHRPLARDDDRFRLPRIGIADRYSFQDFVSIIRGDWDFVGLLQMLRRPGLRM